MNVEYMQDMKFWCLWKSSLRTQKWFVVCQDRIYSPATWTWLIESPAPCCLCPLARSVLSTSNQECILWQTTAGWGLSLFTATPLLWSMPRCVFPQQAKPDAAGRWLSDDLLRQMWKKSTGSLNFEDKSLVNVSFCLLVLLVYRGILRRGEKNNLTAQKD